MKRIIEYLEKNKIEDAGAKAEKMIAYMEGVLEWNEKINLTAIKDPEEFIQKHIIDSLLCITGKELREAGTVIDVGTGGGFPGIPLAITFPEKEFVLMDSLAKRLKIVSGLCAELGIKNVTVVHGRAEEIGRSRERREKSDVCISRAVANMSTLSEYCLPLVKKGGFFIAYKGPDCQQEIEEAGRGISLLGGRVDRIEKPEIEGVDYSHTLVYVIKKKETPKAYPRKAGTPAKKPL